MRSTHSLGLLCLTAVSISACRIEKPSTVVPPPPTVVSFTASAPQAARDGKVTLSWKTTDAVSVELREATTGALAVPEDRLEGSFEAIITGNALFVLSARGPGGSDARAVAVRLDETGAENVTFQALPPTIPGGASTTLVWSAPGATSISLSTGGQAIDVRGQLASGAVSVTPLFDSTYSLVVDGITRTARVTVQPALLTLTATPRAVEAGDPVTLSWTAAGADKIVITSPGRGQLAEITDLAKIATGTYEDTVPALPAGGVVTYEVSAVRGSSSLSRSVEVYVGTGLTIVRLDAPPVASSGAPYSVRWETLAADRVSIELDGVVLHETATRNDAASGIFSFTAPATDFAIELIATNTLGGRTTRVAQVDSVGVPTSATLIAAPATVTAGGAVTLTYACSEARRVRITDADGQTVFSVTGQLAEAGTAVVHPNADTTYTLSADNLLGSTPVTATASVTVTGTPLTLNQFPPTAISGQNVTVGANQTGVLYTGFAHSQVLKSSQADFIDISSTGTKVLETGSNVTSIDLPFATWLWGTRQSGSLTISRAGWIAWGAPLTANASYLSLPSTSTSAPPFLIAPFWADLTLTANSGVFAQLVGNAPEQSMVVQWNRMQVGSTTTTEVTFQVRVHQNGVVSFHYKTMTLSSSTFSSFTAGLQDGSRKIARVSTGTPVSNSAVYFFSPTTSVDSRVVKGTTLGGFIETGASRTLVTRPAFVVDVPDDVTISELMFRPDPAVASGQYVELKNLTGQPLDLTGWVFGSNLQFAFPAGWTLNGNEVALVGASTDPALNDDAGVTLAWGAFSLAVDAGTLRFGTSDAGVTFAYSGPADGGFGQGYEVDPGPLVGTTGSAGAMICPSSTTFGSQTPQQRGSPGGFTGCFPYSLSSIASQFVDISSSGTPILGSGRDDAMYTVTLAATSGDPAPVIFGTAAPIISVSTNGYVRVGTVTTGSSTPKTNASSSNPGTIAVYWSDLIAPPSTAEIFWKRFTANEDPVTPAPHWVIQWSHFDNYDSFFDYAEDDLNFEVKLFEDGRIEYHFAAMTLGYGDANGSYATTWLENPLGTMALPINIQQGRIRPNTGFRFTPR